MPWLERIIIAQNNKQKAIFDIFILLAVGYSCFTNVFYVSFHQTTNKYRIVFDNVIDCCFGLDILLNFLQSYKHPETYENVNDLKRIAKNYVFKGWFFIDFVSTFPWGVFVAGGKFTKLLRLLRLPRMIKLIDISRVNKLIKQFLSNA